MTQNGKPEYKEPYIDSHEVVGDLGIKWKKWLDVKQGEF